MGYLKTGWPAETMPGRERAKKEFGFEARMPFRKGLEKTIQWYRNIQVI